MYIDIHTHNSNFEKDVLGVQNIFLQENNLEENYFSVGLHPWHISDDYANTIYKLKSIIDNKKLLAIGEIGLDKNVLTPLYHQEKALIMQLLYSEKYKLPVVLHIVKAYSEIVSIKLENKFQQPWIIHGFVKKIELANNLIDKGFYLSFGSSLMNDKSNTIKVFEKLDLSKLFLETDDNLEYSIKDIYRKAAEIKKISIENLKEQIFINFKKVFTHYNG